MEGVSQMAQVLKYEGKRKGKTVVTWRVKWRYGGKRDGESQTITCESKTDADDWKREIEKRRHLVRRTDPEVADRSLITGKETAATRKAQAGKTWHEVSTAYLDSKVSGLRPRTEERYRQVLRDHLALWNDMPVQEVTKADVSLLMRRYYDSTGYSGQNILDIAKAVFGYAVENGYRVGNPCKGVKLPDPEETISVFLTKAEQECILRA